MPFCNIYKRITCAVFLLVVVLGQNAFGQTRTYDIDLSGTGVFGATLRAFGTVEVDLSLDRIVSSDLQFQVDNTAPVVLQLVANNDSGLGDIDFFDDMDDLFVAVNPNPNGPGEIIWAAADGSLFIISSGESDGRVSLATSVAGVDVVVFDNPSQGVELGTLAAPEPLLGDVDMNGVVNFLDITPFIALLSTGDFQAEADIDQNGAVNFLDITPFIDLLNN